MNLRQKKIILASASPRRQEVLRQMGLKFMVAPTYIDESYSVELACNDVAANLAQRKAAAYFPNLQADELVIAADTTVVLGGKLLNKPANPGEAKAYLKQLSGKQHQVISAACLRTSNREELIADTTEVCFRHLSDAEIQFYVNQFSPLDKAGAYGIQEWIGLVGVSGIVGSYYNVVGLPAHKVYQTLIELGWIFFDEKP